METLESFVLNYTKPLNRALLHVAFWLLFFGFTFYYNAILPDAFSVTPAKYLGAIRSTVSVMVIFYPLLYVVLPGLLLIKKYALGALAILLLIILYTLVDYALEMLMYDRCHSCLAALQRTLPAYYQFLQSGTGTVVGSRIASLAILYQLLAFLAVPTGIKLGIAYFQQRIQTLHLQQQNLQLEFNFLKAQVNPHFLFNTLNNLYGLVLQDHKQQSAETIARLSDFMRYTLYECNGEKNPVRREIGLLQDYIALEKLRLGDVLINFAIDVDQPAYTLPPLLFLPLVENAFKYVSTGNPENWNTMRLRISKNVLYFDSLNTYDETAPDPKEGGIGIANFSRRLAHYFPGQAVHTINRKNGVYKVSVTITNL